MNDLRQRHKIWLSRRPNGRLRYPRCVRAHLEEILLFSPNALSSEEIQQIKYAMTTTKPTMSKMKAFRIKEYEGLFTEVYEVQGKAWFCWLTIKKFSASLTNEKELWWAKACAQNLLDELNKEQ